MIATAQPTKKRAKKLTPVDHLESGPAQERKEFVAAFEGDPPRDTAAAYEVVDTRDILIGALHPSRFQPRKKFTDESLLELATLMKTHGQLTDLIVRAIGDGSYEIIAGERRWRAAQVGSIPSLRCRVVDWTDAQCEVRALIDNFGREDLNSIDRIRGLRKLLDNGTYKRQIDLAKDLGVDAATLSNQLRTLELPEPWLGWISQEKLGLTVTHARPLLKWVQQPQVLDAMAVELREDYGIDDTTKAEMEGDDFMSLVEPITVSDIENWLQRHAMDLSRPLKGYDYQHARGDVLLTKTQQSDPDLNIAPVGRDKQPRAFNVELWQQYQDAGVARKKSATKAEANGETHDDSERQSLNAQRADDLQARRFAAWRTRTLQTAVVDRLLDQKIQVDTSLILDLLLVFSCQRHGYQREHELLEILPAASRTTNGGLLDRLRLADLGNRWPAARTAVAVWLSHDHEQHDPDVTPDLIAFVAERLKITLAECWQPTAELLGYFSIDQLWQLDNEWATHLNEKQHPTKKALIAALIASDKKKPLPKLLRDTVKKKS